MSAALPPVPPGIAEYTAPYLLGGIWNWCLYGTLIVQFYVYTYNFPTDPRFLKIFVSSLFLIETLQTAFSGSDLYHWFASGYGDLNSFTPNASDFDVPIVGSVASLSVQFFFAYRLWLLGNKKHWWLSGAICVISTVSSTAAFALGIYTHVVYVRNEPPSSRWFKSMKIIWLLGNTVADMLIASAMLYHLIKLKKRDGRFSNHALVSIVRLTIETNILSTTVSLVCAFMVFFYPDESWFTCPAAIIGKVYSNTLLVSLNNRISIRDTMASRGAIRSPAGTFPDSGRSEGTTDIIVLMDIEKSVMPHPLGERESDDKVINVA